MKQLIDLSKYDFKRQTKNYPKNIYAIRVLDKDTNKCYDIAINHHGYCNIAFDYYGYYNDHNESNHLEFLSNLSDTVINSFFKKSKIEKPENYTMLLKIITNSEGELSRYAYSVS